MVHTNLVGVRSKSNRSLHRSCRTRYLLSLITVRSEDSDWGKGVGCLQTVLFKRPTGGSMASVENAFSQGCSVKVFTEDLTI